MCGSWERVWSRLVECKQTLANEGLAIVIIFQVHCIATEALKESIHELANWQ